MSDATPDDRTPHDADLGTDPEVRALLADARVTEPMPTDVAARIDDVLAELAAQRTREGSVADGIRTSVTDLTAARQRRRRRTWWTAAAAAVVVVAGGVALPDVLTDDDPTATARSGAASDHDTPGHDGEALDRIPLAPAADPVTLSRADLRAQVEAHLADRRARVLADTPMSGDAGAPGQKTAPELSAERSDAAYDGMPCPWSGPGRQVAATLDGQPATLVTRRTGTRTVVRVVTCADGPSRVVARLVLEPDS